MFKPLRDKILELAIKGKLVPQLDSESAVEQIGPAPKPEEVPFVIPEKWKWVNLDRTGSFSSGYTPSQEQILGQGDIPFFKVAQMNLKGNEKYLRLTPTFLNTPRKIFEAGTIVFPKLGGAILTNKRRILAQKSVVDTNTAGFLPTKDVLSLEYAYAFLSTLDFGQYARGTAVPALDLSKVKKIWLPLPPLAEQQRIVATLKPLLEELDAMDRAYTELSGPMLKHFKNLVLQQAISGQLVPQLDSEPAVEQIGLAPAKEDEPFALPKKWKWVQSKYMGSWKSGATPRRDNAEFWENGTVPWLKTGEVSNGLVLATEEFVTEKAVKQARLRLNPEGSVLIAMYGTGTVGNIGVLGIPCTTNQACCACIIDSDVVISWFLFYVLLAFRSLLIDKASGTTNLQNLSKDKIEKIWIPLPPIAEQRRIVARIEELFGDVDKLLEWQQFA